MVGPMTGSAAAYGEQIRNAVGQAVRCLQFEDIATQALGSAVRHANRIDAVNAETVRLQSLVESTHVTRPAAPAPMLRKNGPPGWVTPILPNTDELILNVMLP